MPIGSEVADALCAQLGREFEAHVQYLSIASWFDAEGLPELKGFFAAQAAEEHEHAMRFLAYLQDAGARVAIPAVAAPRPDFESAEDAVALSLQQEEEVTRRIHELVELTGAHRDHATAVFLQWFVTEQVEELAVIGELLQTVRRAEGSLLLVEDYVARAASRARPAPPPGPASRMRA